MGGLLKSHSTLLGRKIGLADGQGGIWTWHIKEQSPFDHLMPFHNQGFGGSALDSSMENGSFSWGLLLQTWEYYVPTEMSGFLG